MAIKQINPTLWLLDGRVWKDGKEYRRREEMHGGRKAAEARFAEILKELRAKAENRSLTITEFRTFGECLDFYLAEGASEKSRAGAYFERLRLLNNTPLSDLSRHFKEFLRLEKKSISRRTGQALSPAALNKLKVFAIAACNYALQEERITKNPLVGIKKDREKARWVVINDFEERALLDAVSSVSPDILPLITFMVDVPARRREMIEAKREYFDPFRNQINLPGDLTKNERPCTKPVPPHLISYFRSIPQDCPWLFYRKDASGNYHSLGFIQKRWEKARDAAGLPGLRLHDLRHRACSKLIAAGNPRTYVMAVAGWVTDMLSIYWNQPGEDIAGSIIFQGKPDTRPDTLSKESRQNGEISRILAVS